MGFTSTLPKFQVHSSEHNKVRFCAQRKAIAGSRKLTLSLGLAIPFTLKTISFLVQASTAASRCVPITMEAGASSPKEAGERKNRSPKCSRSLEGSTKVGIPSWEVSRNFVPSAFAQIANPKHWDQYPAVTGTGVLQDVTPGGWPGQGCDYFSQLHAHQSQWKTLQTPAPQRSLRHLSEHQVGLWQQMSYRKTFWDKAWVATKESPKGFSTSQLATNADAVRVCRGGVGSAHVRWQTHASSDGGGCGGEAYCRNTCVMGTRPADCSTQSRNLHLCATS